MRSVRLCVMLTGVFLLWAAQAVAAERFIVLPIQVQGPEGYAYLERSIPQMLTSRLYWKGQVEPAVADLPASQKAVSNESDAVKAMNAFKANYVIWGTVTILDKNYSLDIRVRDKNGKVWPQAHEGKVNQLISAISTISDSINRQVFGRKVAPSSSSSSAATPVNQMHPDLVVNQDRPKDVYLNPQFRYAGKSGQDDSRLRSQTLQYKSLGMEVVDADGDGRNEIFILGDNRLYAYRFEGNRLNPIGEVDLPMSYQTLSIRSLPHPSGKAWIIVNMIDTKDVPQGSIFTFSGGKFNEEYRKIHLFMNVVRMAPDYRPRLIVQRPGKPRLFASGVYEGIPTGGNITTAGRLNLPESANVFNFAALPAGRDAENQSKIVVLTARETLRAYTESGAVLTESEEKYSGAAIGIETNAAMPGMGRETVTAGETFYIPMRMIPIDIESDGNYELLVNRPISTASNIFDRYRFFPQSEIHSLFWDGIGLNLQWKTRRIKGSTVDYTLADANNDGIEDLVVCINTHPGALGANARRTIVLLYPLDTSAMDANTSANNAEIFD